MSEKPTFVFVHGAGHSPETWDKVRTLLEEQHYQCVAVALPSTAGNASATFGEDIGAVRDSIITETTQERDVVVVVHSWGGVVGPSAIKGLARTKQEVSSPAKNPSGHVIGLVMIACGFVKTGVSFIDSLGGKPPPAWRTDPSGFAIVTVPSRELFYQDLPEEEGEYWVSKLRKQSQKALMEDGELSYAGWLDVPVWYLATTEDKALPIKAQRMFVKSSQAVGGDITMRDIESSHSPMLSRPRETADFILEAMASFME